MVVLNGTLDRLFFRCWLISIRISRCCRSIERLASITVKPNSDTIRSYSSENLSLEHREALFRLIRQTNIRSGFVVLQGLAFPRLFDPIATSSGALKKKATVGFTANE